MPLDPVDQLLEEIVTTGRGKWPTPRELRVTKTVATWRAFLESDRDALRIVADWPATRAYKVDPLAPLIADTWADHLFDADLTITPAAPADQGTLEYILEQNVDFDGDVHEAARRVVGLGEEWWRAFVDRELADTPILEWHDRDVVVPLYIGRRLLAAALVTQLPPKPRSKAVFRHFEIHADGVVEHVLFRGTTGRIGQTVPLETHPDLVDLASELGAANGDRQRWEHGLPMLMGRVTNGRRVNRKLNLGVSDYDRITDQLLDLNEATTIAGENVRLTAKKRVVVPESAIEQRRAAFAGALEDRGDGFLVATGQPGGATFDAGEDVYVTSQLDAELGKSTDGPFKVLEYSFDALPLLAHKADVVQTALTRVALTPQYVGVAEDSPGVLSGTAYRLKLIPTTKGGKGKGRPWDDTLPHALMLLAMLDALPEADGGFGRSWANAVTPPAVERSPSLPRDDVEDSQIEVALVGAGVRSKRTSVKAQHPDWDDAQVDDELALIAKEAPTSAAAAGFGAAFA